MKQIFIAATALTLFAAPAHAQLLGGGGGLGGAVGGSIGGAGSIGSVGSLPSDAVRGTISSSADVRGSGQVDRRSGRVDAGGQSSGSLSGGITGALGTPATSASGTSSATGSGSVGGSASAELIGTDVVRSTAGAVAGRVRGSGETAVQRGQAVATNALGTTSSVAGIAQGAASGAASFSSSSLAAAGSLAAQAQNAFAVNRGTAIFDAAGERIGRVRQVVADTRGQVEQLLVSVGGERALLPAGNFRVTGDALVSAMSEAQIERLAEQQEEAR
jgi:hypothetical protein